MAHANEKMVAARVVAEIPGDALVRAMAKARKTKAKQGKNAPLGVVSIKTSTAEAMTGAPVTAAPSLRGVQTAKALSAAELRSQFVMAYNETPLDVATNGVAVQRGTRLLELFSQYPQETVKEALNAKESGFAYGSSERTIISEENTLYRGYLADAKHVAPMLTNASIMFDGKQVFGWRQRVDAVRDMLKTKRDAVALAKASVERAMTDTGTLDAEALTVAAALVTAESAKAKADKKAERATPEFIGRDNAKRIIKGMADHGKTPKETRDWLRIYRAAFDGYVTEWRGENSAALADEPSK